LPPAKGDVAMMAPTRSRFAFENGLLMDVLSQLAAARSMYITPGMHPAWRRPSNGSPIVITPVVDPASPVTPAREHPANDKPQECKPEMPPPVTTAKAITADQTTRRMRNAVPNVEARSADENLPTAVKAHYSVIELAALWGWSRSTITRQFANEPGVLRLDNSGTGKRKYVSLSIPASVADRVQARISNQPLQPFRAVSDPLVVMPLGDVHAGVPQQPRYIRNIKSRR